MEGDDSGYKPSYFRTNWFNPVGREVKNTMENVTIADITAFAKISVEGKGARKFLDYMVANKIPEVCITVVMFTQGYQCFVINEDYAGETKSFTDMICSGTSEY